MTHPSFRCVTINRLLVTRVTHLSAGTARRGNNRLAKVLRDITVILHTLEHSQSAIVDCQSTLRHTWTSPRVRDKRNKMDWIQTAILFNASNGCEIHCREHSYVPRAVLAVGPLKRKMKIALIVLVRLYTLSAAYVFSWRLHEYADNCKIFNLHFFTKLFIKNNTLRIYVYVYIRKRNMRKI